MADGPTTGTVLTG